MARRGQLPQAEMEVAELLGGSPAGPTAADAAASAGEDADVGESVPAAEAMPGLKAPEGTESVPAGEAMPGGAPDGPMPLIESAILDVHSTGRAGMQGGDSGGPFFVDGKLAGLATAGTANGDPDPVSYTHLTLPTILLV